MIFRRLGLFILWALSLAGITLYGGVISYGFFFAITILPLISFAELFIILLTLRVYQELGSRTVECGEMTDYYFTLQNPSPFSYPGVRVRLFPDFFDVLDMPQNIEYELMPNDEVRFYTKLTCKYRGEYKIGIQAIVLTDFLHIFRIKYNLLSTYEAIVKPKLIHIDSLMALEVIETKQTFESKSGTTYPDAIVRKYMPGDSMRIIHWKATAKTSSLMVRKYYDESKQGVGIYFEQKRYTDIQKEFLPLENKMLEILLAVSAFFVYRNVPVDISYGAANGLKEDYVADPKEYDLFYERVTKIKFSKETDTSECRKGFQNKVMNRQENILFYIVHEIDDELLLMTDNMINTGRYVVLYLVNECKKEEYAGYSNERRQIIGIGEEEDITTIL